MSSIENTRVRTPLRVLGKDVTLPAWLEEVTSQQIIEKGKALVESYHGLSNFHVYRRTIVAIAKGSKGSRYLTKVSIWDKEKDEVPALLTCSCPHGVYAGRGLCYHRVALVLKVLSMNGMPEPKAPQTYEDDFELE